MIQMQKAPKQILGVVLNGHIIERVDCERIPLLRRMAEYFEAEQAAASADGDFGTVVAIR